MTLYTLVRASSNLNIFDLQEVREFLSILDVYNIFFCRVLAALEEIDYLEKKNSSQSEHQDIMEQASIDPFSKKYKKYNLHEKEKLMRIFLSVLIFCSVLLLVYLDFATLYYYFARYYYSELKSIEQYLCSQYLTNC